MNISAIVQTLIAFFNKFKSFFTKNVEEQIRIEVEEEKKILKGAFPGRETNNENANSGMFPK